MITLHLGRELYSSEKLIKKARLMKKQKWARNLRKHPEIYRSLA